MESEFEIQSISRLIAYEAALSEWHDVKNNAQSALSMLDRLEVGLRASPMLRPAIVELEGAKECVRRILGACSARRRILPLDSEPADLNQIVRMAVAALNGPLQNIEVIERYGDIPLMHVEAREIREIVSNLLLNSIEAIRLRGNPGGTILVTTTIDPAGRIPAVRIQVEDNGVGVAPEEAPKLFILGHTTRKGAGGMGLFISKRIAENYGARISLTSRPGSGASVVVSLPLRRNRS